VTVGVDLLGKLLVTLGPEPEEKGTTVVRAPDVKS